MFNTRPYPNGGHVLDANHQVNNNIQKEGGRGRKGWFHSYLYSLDGLSQNGGPMGVDKAHGKGENNENENMGK